MPSPKKPKPEQRWSNAKLFGFGLIAAVLLLVANSAFWANNQLFNTANFSRTATSAITAESSRQAIATSLTERIFADRPVALQVVGDTSTKLISGLLDSQRFESAVARATTRLQTYVTSEDQQSVVINLEGLKQVISTLIALSDQAGATRVDPAQIPNEITVVDADNFPSFYNQGVTLLWLGPLALIGATLLLAWPHIKRRAERVTAIGLQATALLTGSVLALLIGPLFRPMFLAKANSESGRVVLENLYNGFIGTFNDQTMWLIWLALLAILAAGGLWFRQSRQAAK